MPLTRFTGRPESDVLILSPVVWRIAREHRVSEDVARGWLEEALRFLDAASRAERAIPPDPEADRAWHEFILHTRQYEAYCQERFGRFIHHDPYEDGDPGTARFWRRRRRRQAAGGGGGACGGGSPGGGSSDSGGDGGGDGGGGCGGGGCGGGS